MSRPVDLARLGLGVAALAAPRALLPAAADTRWTRGFTRILGARYVVQSGLGLLDHRPWVPEVDVAVDAIHAVTMIGLAGVSPRHRPVALVSALAAIVFAGADYAERVR